MLLVRFRINNETFVDLFERSDFLFVGCVCCSVFYSVKVFFCYFWMLVL